MADEDLKVEVIEFKRPWENRKSLYISQLVGTEDDIYHFLYNQFSKYGLVFEIRIFTSLLPLKFSRTGAGNNSTTISKTDDCMNSSSTAHDELALTLQRGNSNCYAFVNYYSHFSAKQAKDALTGALEFNGIMCKIAYSKRKAVTEPPSKLYCIKCQELANYYLGFNAWNSTIISLCEDATNDLSKVRWACHVRIDIKKAGLHSDGFGAWEENYNPQDFMQKQNVMCKVKKIAYQRALEGAFSKVVIIVLSNGKVSVEINTTHVEIMLEELGNYEHEVLKVNELDTEPDVEEDEEHADDRLNGNLDDQNMQILQELEAG